MSNNTIQRSLKMTAEQWLRLEQLATDFDCREHVGQGHQMHIPKWQLLIRRIASDEFRLALINPYTLPAGLAEQADEIERQQREQERIVERQKRVEMHTVAKQAVRKTPVKLVQMSILDLEPA